MELWGVEFRHRTATIICAPVTQVRVTVPKYITEVLISMKAKFMMLFGASKRLFLAMKSATVIRSETSSWYLPVAATRSQIVVEENLSRVFTIRHYSRPANVTTFSYCYRRILTTLSGSGQVFA